jgi:hypothetical protein
VSQIYNTRPLAAKNSTYADLPPLLSVEAMGVCILIGHTEMLLASVYKSSL